MKHIRIIALCLPAIMLATTISAAVPELAKNHQRTLTKVARTHWGLNAPVALFAGQIHQESSWRVNARSPVGAQGLAQFMPATSEWFAKLHPIDLGTISGTAQPYNPTWAMSAMVLYDRHLYQQIQASSPCQQWAFTLSAYNGGLTWVKRDQQLASASGADSLVWFDETERHNAGRSAANFRENRHYPQKIIRQWQQVYVAAGWGLGVCYDF